MQDHRQIVKTSSYSSEYRRLPRGLIFFERETLVAKPLVEIDVFGNFWSIAFSHSIPVGKLSIGRHKNKIPLVGTQAVFLPPHSIVEWHLAPGPFHWKALISFNELPADIPREPLLFSWNGESTPTSLEEAISLLREVKNPIAIGKEETPSAVASRTKAFLDEHYMESIPLTEIARRLKYAHGVMDRSFKSCFGFSPIAYRNRKRITTASMLMLWGEQKVSSVGHSVGFIDLGRFHKQFRKIMNATPSQFRLEKNL